MDIPRRPAARLRYRLAPATGPLTEEIFRKTPLAFVGNASLRWDSDETTDLDYDPAARGWETWFGTTPAGSAWRKNPIPSGLWQREGPTFAPVCEESAECIHAYSVAFGAALHDPSIAGRCKCSGYSNGGPLLPNLEIVDRVRVPEVAPGRYVLQWRTFAARMICKRFAATPRLRRVFHGDGSKRDAAAATRIFRGDEAALDVEIWRPAHAPTGWDCEESDQVWASCADIAIEA